MTMISIVIVRYNARRDLETCLESLASAPPTTPHDIVVVDNASTEPGLDAIRARWPSIGVIELPENVGFAAANNVGIRATAGDLVLLLNSDTIVPAGTIDRLASRLVADDRVAVAGPRLLDSDGRVELSFGPMLSPVGELRQKIVTRLHMRGVGVVSSWVARATSRERTVDWVSGACLLVRRRAAVEAGLLDERFFLYTEDVDFCAAIRARGWRVLFTPAAEIVHLRGRSRATAAAAANAAYRRSHLAFYEKHHPRWAPFLRLYLRLRNQLPPG
jgi:GT2 family glycosyltransferase